MDNTSATLWNNYHVHGDTRELDHIIETCGIINLDMHDIIETLSHDGNNYLVTACDTDLPSALNAAIARLPMPITNADNLLISIQYGLNQPMMADMKALTSSLADTDPQTALIWGVETNPALGNAVKVIILASFPGVE